VDDVSFARFWAESRARAAASAVAASARSSSRRAFHAISPRRRGAAFEEASEAERCLEAGRRRLPALLRRDGERAAPRLRDYLLRRGYRRPR